MTKISTEDCKKAIIDWVDTNPEYWEYLTKPVIKDISRVSKTKTTSGLWLRKFEIRNTLKYYSDLWVLEHADGALSVLQDDPDREWTFAIWKDDDERVVYFACSDVEADSHVEHLISHRLPPDADEVIESGFMFDDDRSDIQLNLIS